MNLQFPNGPTVFRPDRRRGTLPLSLALALAAASPLMQAPLAQAEVTDPSELENLKAQVGTSLERKKKLEADAARAAQDVTATRRDLITTAAKVQKSEAAVSASEARLQKLSLDEAELLAQLQARRARMTDLLGALARLDRNPPPALAVRPDDALGAIRGAILLGEAVPELKAQADDLKERLQALMSLRESIIAESKTLAQAAASLKRDRAEVEDLLAQKLAAQKKLNLAATTEEARAARLSREATDLNDLIAQLESQAQSRLPKIRPEPQPPEKKAPKPVRPVAPPVSVGEAPRNGGKGAELALLTPPAEPAALPSSRHFSEAKGLIRLPATGLLLSGFGQPNNAGGKTEGMTIATRPNAQVVAPFDGKIVFAGPFRRYGQLLILSVGEGYHVLLAGMTRIDGSVGQSVLAGEPLGHMGGPANENLPASADESNQKRGNTATEGRPSLYIEFRKDSDPIDPRPWLTMSDTKARG